MPVSLHKSVLVEDTGLENTYKRLGYCVSLAWRLMPVFTAHEKAEAGGLPQI